MHALINQIGENWAINDSQASFQKIVSLLDEALAKSTPDAYNPFCGGNCSSEEDFTVTIFRGNTSNLYMWDFKMSNNDIYEMPAGSVAMLVGFEARKEWTNNPAWCFYDLITNNRYGLGEYIDSDIVS